MRRNITLLFAMFSFVLISWDTSAQGTVPEILYYKFDQTGTSVTNAASSPPVGTGSGTINGLSQGGTGLCGGALIGNGASSSTNNVNTGWNTNLGSGAWTIAFWIDALPVNTTLHYQFGDAGASSFRCFNNGVAGAGNFMLRGPLTDVTCTGCAPNNTPSMTVFVYDPALSNIKAYHNGVLNNTVSQGALNISGTGFTVGGYSGSTGMGANQLMDEFRVYDRALDATEVFNTFNACLPLVQLPDDAGIVNFVNPVIPTCQFNDTVSVTLKNHGTDTLTSVNINWKRNTTTLTPLFWTGALAPQASATVFVGTTPYITGDNLYAWTTNPNGVVENPAGSFNDSSEIIGLSTGLSGPYTIGGATPDFSDVPSAIAALNFAGICGPVTFNIRSGTYTDQFDLAQIAEMDAAKTVTFRSEAGHRDSVTFNYISTGTANNYVVKMSNADYYRLESMTFNNAGTTYGRVFDISGGSENNIILDCKIQTQTSNTTSNNSCVIYSPSGSNDDFNRFENNSIIGGSYGAYWWGSGTTSLEKGSVWKDNEFLDNYYMGLYSYYQENNQIIGNRFYGQSTYTGSRYGLYAVYNDKAFVFTHNSIESNASSNYTYGIYLSNCDASASGRGLVSNNSVTVGSSGQTGTKYGVYLTNSGFIDIYNNSASVVGGSTSSRAAYVTGGGANNVKNNTFTNFDGSYAIYVLSAYAINEMDYNNYYTTGTNIGYYDAGNTATFADWQLASGYDANSINVNPGFYSDFDLHVCSDSLNGKGTPLALITDDRDMQSRNATTPDIGSDEFAPLGLPGFLGPDKLVCTGQTVSINAGAPSDQVLWSTGDTTNTLVVTTPGTYTVSVIGACGTSFDTIAVTASALAYTGFLVADQTTFCSGSSALLTSTMPATTYSWTGGSSNDSLVVTTSGNYTLNISDACGSGSESVTITVNTVPVASFTTMPSFFTGVFTNTSTGGGTQTYLWNFGDGTTSTQMSPTHIYNTIGTFTVTLTVTNACGTNTTTQTITTSNLGLEEVEGLGTISVYPNPTTGTFNIDFSTINDVNIAVKVTNVLGQTVYAKNIGSINGTQNNTIDITNEAPGVYYVTIVSDNKTVMTNLLMKQ